MSEQPQNNSNQELKNFFAILTNTNSILTPIETETENISTQSNDSNKANSKSSSKFNLKKTSQQENKVDQEFEVLQELLGKSQIEQIKDRVFSLETKYNQLIQEKDELKNKYNQLKEKVAQQNDNIRDQNKLFTQILKENLAQLKQDLLIEIAIMLEKIVVENIQQERKLSIKVVGLQKNSEQ